MYLVCVRLKLWCISYLYQLFIWNQKTTVKVYNSKSQSIVHHCDTVIHIQCNPDTDKRKQTFQVFNPYARVQLYPAKGTMKKISTASDMTFCSGRSRISRRGGVDLVRGAVDPQGGYVSKILHVKMKESGPVGGGGAPGAPPRSANVLSSLTI